MNAIGTICAICAFRCSIKGTIVQPTPVLLLIRRHVKLIALPGTKRTVLPVEALNLLINTVIADQSGFVDVVRLLEQYSGTNSCFFGGLIGDPVAAAFDDSGLTAVSCGARSKGGDNVGADHGTWGEDVQGDSELFVEIHSRAAKETNNGVLEVNVRLYSDS